MDWLARAGKSTEYFFSTDDFDLINRHLNSGDMKLGFQIYRLTLNGKIIAVQLATKHLHSIDLLHITHDSAFDKYSAGSILLEDVMKSAFDEQLEIDLGLTEFSWKKAICNYKSDAFGVVLFLGKAAIALPFYRSALKTRLGRWSLRQLNKLAKVPRTV